MKSSNRILMFFGVGLALVIVVAVILVLTIGRGNAPLLSENSPEGTVQRYLLAVQQKDYSGAYALIAQFPTPTDSFKSPPGPPNSFNFWLMSAQNASNVTWKATLDKTTVNGATANVQISLEVFRPGAPFNNPVHQLTQIFVLVRGRKFVAHQFSDRLLLDILK